MPIGLILASVVSVPMAFFFGFVCGKQEEAKKYEKEN